MENAIGILGVCTYSFQRTLNIGEVRLTICGQSYNHFTIINYDSSIVIWGIFKSGTTLEA